MKEAKAEAEEEEEEEAEAAVEGAAAEEEGAEEMRGDKTGLAKKRDVLDVAEGTPPRPVWDPKHSDVWNQIHGALPLDDGHELSREEKVAERKAGFAERKAERERRRQAAKDGKEVDEKEPAHVAVDASTCISIRAPTTDNWCKNVCAEDCPAEMCACDAEAAGKTRLSRRRRRQRQRRRRAAAAPAAAAAAAPAHRRRGRLRRRGGAVRRQRRCCGHECGGGAQGAVLREGA